MTLILVGVLLLGVTTVHEAGHWVAVRWKGGVVHRVILGRGPCLWRSRRGPLELRLLPLGGRIDWAGVPPGSARAVVALAGPLSNLLLACLGIGIALGTGVPDSPLFGGGDGSLLGGLAREVGGWLWLIPGAAEELLRQGGGTELGRAVRGLGVLLGSEGWRVLPYAVGAISGGWCALNLLPLPVLRTDGWVILVSILEALRGNGARG